MDRIEYPQAGTPGELESQIERIIHQGRRYFQPRASEMGLPGGIDFALFFVYLSQRNPYDWQVQRERDLQLLFDPRGLIGAGGLQKNHGIALDQRLLDFFLS